MTAIKGMSELKAAFKELGQKFGKNAVVGVALAQTAAVADIQEKAPLGHMPGLTHGDYRRSIHAEPPFESGGKIVGYVGTNKIQAKQLEFGGPIKARNKPYLVFKLEDGTWVRTKTVIQPGKPHFRPVMDQNSGKYRKIIEEQMTR